jgi:hypothetical protein
MIKRKKKGSTLANRETERLDAESLEAQRMQNMQYSLFSPAQRQKVDNPIVAASDSDSESEWVKGIQEVISENELGIGDLVEEKFLDFSYVLHLSGDIRNRKTNELLSDLNPESAIKVGTLLIARKPSGGRLRVTEDGKVGAYFEDHWGYIATVTPEQWFPEHLFHKV